MMRKQPSDRQLRRWLSTGKPRRVERLIERDPAITARLDELSRLDAAQTAALADVSAPPAGFPDRTIMAIRDRVDTYETIALVADLLGLGWRTGRAVLGDWPEPPDAERWEIPEP